MKRMIGSDLPGISGMPRDEFPETKARCPECYELTRVDPDFSEQICEHCGETFYDESEPLWTEPMIGGQRR